MRFRWTDDDELNNAAVVADWTAGDFSLRESHAELKRDITEEVGLADWELPDNWTDTTSNMLSMQFAVEDFNYDGFLDIATTGFQSFDRENRMDERASGGLS